MRVSAVAGFAFLILSGCGAAQLPDPIAYEISFENREHHEAEITVTFTGLSSDPLELRMSRSSPGRYALHEFAKNVYNVRATGVDGRAVTIDRPNVHQWDVSDHGGSVTVSYTLSGDHADGTYVGIDRTHGHLNMPATFMWARNLEDRPIELTVHTPEGSGRRVATQLAPTRDPSRFTAPNLYYFLDSPTEVSDFWLEEGAAAVLQAPLMGSPLYQAGVDQGDRITAIDGVAPSDGGGLDDLISSRFRGDAVEIRYESRGQSFVVTVDLGEDPTLGGQWLPDGAVTAEQAAFRAAWKSAIGG
jgi:predicted metalloprotease with PDZ domain